MSRRLRIGLCFAFATASLVTVSQAAFAQGIERMPAPAGARVYVIAPHPGETVRSPVIVRFGLSGMGVAPAGIERQNTGHHHVLVDTGVPDLTLPVPTDEHHRHFGGGQTQVALELAPGEHTVQLLLGDHRHVPHEPPVLSEQVRFTVVP